MGGFQCIPDVDNCCQCISLQVAIILICFITMGTDNFICRYHNLIDGYDDCYFYRFKKDKNDENQNGKDEMKGRCNEFIISRLHNARGDGGGGIRNNAISHMHRGRDSGGNKSFLEMNVLNSSKNLAHLRENDFKDGVIPPVLLNSTIHKILPIVENNVNEDYNKYKYNSFVFYGINPELFFRARILISWFAGLCLMLALVMNLKVLYVVWILITITVLIIYLLIVLASVTTSPMYLLFLVANIAITIYFIIVVNSAARGHNEALNVEMSNP